MALRVYLNSHDIKAILTPQSFGKGGTSRRRWVDSHEVSKLFSEPIHTKVAGEPTKKSVIISLWDWL